jgi:hypothetical protein
MRTHGLTRTSGRPPRWVTFGALALSVGAVVALLLPGGGAAAVACRDRVIADWSDNGRIDHSYPLACYRDAVKHLPEDLRSYSSAPDDIRQALTERRSLQRHSRAVASQPATLAAAPSSSGRPSVAVVVPAVAGLFTLLSVTAWLARRRPRLFRRD